MNHGNQPPDLVGMEALDLSSYFTPGARLIGWHAQRSIVQDACASGALILDCDFTGSFFRRCDFAEAIFENCILDSAAFRWVNTSGANGLVFRNCKLRGAMLPGGSNLIDCEIFATHEEGDPAPRIDGIPPWAMGGNSIPR